MRHSQLAHGHVGVDVETGDLKEAVHAGVTKLTTDGATGIVDLSKLKKIEPASRPLVC